MSVRESSPTTSPVVVPVRERHLDLVGPVHTWRLVRTSPLAYDHEAEPRERWVSASLRPAPRGREGAPLRPKNSKERVCIRAS